jgi:DNA-directed RNA polymerase III subunit RPC2
MSYSGYDIEDAVILNRSSLDRGFGRAVFYRRYQSNFKSHDWEIVDKLEPPPKIPPPTDAKHARMKRYHALDKDGLACVNEKLNDGDVYMNKRNPDMATLKIDQITKQPDKDSVVYNKEEQSFKGSNPVYVDRMILTKN